MESNTTYRVIVSDRAKRMLGEHIRFLAKNSPDAAKKKKQQILAVLHSLKQFPQRYPFLNASYIPPNKYHKIFIENCYLVLYQIQDDTVYVDYILDCRKDYEWLVWLKT